MEENHALAVLHHERGELYAKARDVSIGGDLDMLKDVRVQIGDVDQAISMLGLCHMLRKVIADKD